MMEYKGYQARVEFDADSRTFHGEVINIRDVITFRGTSVRELQRELAASVEDYLAFCTERGEDPERPYSGRFLVRVPPEVHRAAAIAAARAGRSLNSWVAERLERAVGR
jgi:predicted HicB family RNase H-like nuclease